MSSTTMPPNLRLVFEHLNAVRELDRYLRKKGVDKDMEGYLKEVFRPALEERVPTVKSWNCEPDVISAEWYPDLWQVKRDAYVTVRVVLPDPLSQYDPNPSVNIWVPEDWLGRKSFNDRATACVKTLLEEGFELGVDNDWDEEFAIGKWVNWLEPDGSFDENRLVDRIASEVEKIVRFEPGITEMILKASKKATVKPSKKKVTPKPSKARQKAKA